MGLLANILAIDDDDTFREELKQTLEPEFSVRAVSEISSAMKTITQGWPDLILLDMNMPDVSGLDFLRALRLRHVNLPVIMLTGESKPALIVEAMKAGANDYVVKGSTDFIPSLRIRISQAQKISGIKRENEILNTKLKESASKYEILGISSSAIRMRSEIAKYQGTNAFVLIQGENGTGKELVARNLNLQENDSSRPFVAVNCGAIPSNLFESELFGHVKGAFTGAISDQAGKFVSARGGDIFLDEIGELPLDMQVKLLRVLQEKTVTPVGSPKNISVDVRVIAATNRKLEDLVREGKFRQDLFYRLNQITMRTVPLRERKEDIFYLAQLFAKKNLPGVTISKEARDILESHLWPGNIRELQNTMERACLFVRGTSKVQIAPEHLSLADIGVIGGSVLVPQYLLPSGITDLNPSSFRECLDWMERMFLEKGLELLSGDNSKLLERLGISKAHYYRRKKALGIAEEKSAGAM